MPAPRLPIIGPPHAAPPLESVVRAGLQSVGADMALEGMDPRPHQLADALRAVRDADDCPGALIIAPHKEKAASLVAGLSDDARVSGAVNVVVRANGRLRGHNTDMDGVRSALAGILPRVQGKWPREAVVLGAGGGARAVVAVLVSSGFQHVAVLNRHLHKAEAVAAHFGRYARHAEVRARPWHDAIIEVELARAGLLVNASGQNAGASGPVVPSELIPDGRYVLDLLLDMGETPLMAAARERGGTVANGSDAFVAACAATVRLLTGVEPNVSVLREALTGASAIQEQSGTVLGD
jgi:shikimate dehydrogenase